MVICLRRYVYGQREEFRFLCKWDESELDFDISDSRKWRSFLLRLTLNGVPLPRLNKDGKPYLYNAYSWGGQPVYTNLYPGRDRRGRKLKTHIYSRLDKNVGGYWLR